MHEKLIAKSSMRRFLLEIITQAIFNENSIFYKDYLHSELGDKNTFISLIFGNAEFIQSHFTPLLSLNERCHSPLSEAQFNLYTQIQEIILDKYLGCHDAFRNKDCVMRPLLGLINSESAVISQDPGLENLTTLNYIWKVQDYLQINVIWKQLEEIVTQENPEIPFEQDLTDMLTKLLFKHFLTLSKIKVRNDRFGSILESFWMFLNARYTEGSMGSKIQEKFEEHIFKHLNNMHPIDSRITGCLINSLLMTYIYHNSIDNRWKTHPVMASLHHLPKSPIMNTWSGKFSEKFAQFLRENFGKTAPFELDDFLKRLPENIRYDATNHILYFVPFGREQEESFSLYDHENQQNIQT